MMLLVPRMENVGVNENVTLKYDGLPLSFVFRVYSIQFTLYITRANGFKVKIENEWFVAVCSCCRQNLKFGDFTLLSQLWSPKNKCTEMLLLYPPS